MKVIPAIDLKEGRVVRLRQGDFDQIKRYKTTPLTIALDYQNQGAKRLHIVDLDGAKTGKRDNYQTIETLVKTLVIPVQVGGGIRTYDDAKTLFDIGVDSVIVGTMAFSQVEDLKRLVKDYGKRIIVALDVREENVLTQGWQVETQQNIYDFSAFLMTLGIQKILVTDVAKDGMMLGPNIALYQRLKKRTKLEVIASGGVAKLKDLSDLKTTGVEAVVVGKALLDNVFTYLEVSQC